MPRQLLQYSEWNVIKIDVHDARAGDIIFVKNIDKPKLISHVALFLSQDIIFHCSDIFKKAVVEAQEDFFIHYEQKLNFCEMIRFIDPRSVRLREQNAGFFIK